MNTAPEKCGTPLRIPTYNNGSIKKRGDKAAEILFEEIIIENFPN